MTTDQNKSTVSRLVEEGYNKHNFKLLDEIFAKDAISHDPSQPNLGRGPDGARESMKTPSKGPPSACTRAPAAHAACSRVKRALIA